MRIRHKSPWWQRIARRGSRELFRWAENNGDTRMTHNGERWLLRELLRAHAAGCSGRPFVVFDVGANVGNYTRMILDEARRMECVVEIHAFEPSPAAAAKLRESVPAAVHVVGVALSDWTGEAPLHAGELGSSHASLVDRRLAIESAGRAVRVSVQRADEYLRASGIAHIDLLKLDVEGSELAALRGLGEFLRPEVVDAIQFEYGGTTRDAHVALRDLYDHLVAHGLVFAKLFPDALELRTYNEWMDNFSFANYAAVAPRWLRTTKTGAFPL